MAKETFFSMDDVPFISLYLKIFHVSEIVNMCLYLNTRSLHLFKKKLEIMLIYSHSQINGSIIMGVF